MVKKSQITNSSPGYPLKRQKPNENVRMTAGSSQASVASTKPSSPSKKPDSNMTPTRFSTRKSRPTTKAVAMEDSSDSDGTPPPSIISRKRKVSEKRTPRKSSMEKGLLMENDGKTKDRNEKPSDEVIDLTNPRNLSPKLSRKRPKVDRRLPVDLDTFINLCSDEETNPQPRKKRKVTSPDEVIFISSGDEAELPETRTSPSLPCAEEMRISNDEGSVRGSPNSIPAATATQNITETNHDGRDVSTPSPTPPPVSPPGNDSPEFIIDIAANQNMTGVEEISTPKLSQQLLNTLYQESVHHPPPMPSTSEECSTSFCNTSVPSKQPLLKIAYTDKPAKPALLTSLFFARAMNSLSKVRPKTNAISKPSKAAALIESHVQETSPLDTVPRKFQPVLDTPRSTISTLQGYTDFADVPMRHKSVDTHEDIYIPSTDSLMGVDETQIEPVLSPTELLIPNAAVPSSCQNDPPAMDVSSMEIVAEEQAVMVAYDTDTPAGQTADDDTLPSPYTNATLMQDVQPVETVAGEHAVIDAYDTSTSHEPKTDTTALSFFPGETPAPCLETVEASISHQGQSADTPLPTSSTSESPTGDIPSTSTSHEGQGATVPSAYTGETPAKTAPAGAEGAVMGACNTSTSRHGHTAGFPTKDVAPMGSGVESHAFLASCVTSQEGQTAGTTVPPSYTGESPSKDLPSSMVIDAEKPTAMEVYDTSVSPGAAPFSYAGESSTKDIPAPETVAEDHAVMDAYDTSTSGERAGDHVEYPITSAVPDPIQNHPQESEILPSTDAESILQLSKKTSEPFLACQPQSTTAVEEQVDSLPDISPPSSILPIFEIIPSIFELEHLPNLSFQVLFGPNKIVDDVNDLTISLPCYPNY